MEQWPDLGKWQKSWKETDLRNSGRGHETGPNDCLYVWGKKKGKMEI